MAVIIDGKQISQQIKDELKVKAEKLRAEGKTGALAVIQVGNDRSEERRVGKECT